MKGIMGEHSRSTGRRERAKEDKRQRIMAAATALFSAHGVGGVTTQQIADEADVVAGTLFLYTASKAELLIMVQNEKFAAAIDEGLAAADAARESKAYTVTTVMALLRPVLECVRAQPENGRTYLHELVFGDPEEPHRAAGLAQAMRLETAVTETLARSPVIPDEDAATLTRVITAIIHVTPTATVHLHEPLPEILRLTRTQLTAILPPTASA